MENYKKIIEEASEKNSSIVIYNSDKNHAKLLVSKMIEKAQEEIKLYTSGCDILFYNESENIKNSLANKNKLKIQIIFDDNVNKDKFKEIFPKAEFYCKKKDISDFQLKFSDSTELIDDDYKIIKHFMVIDNKMFRIESPHEPKAEVVNALGCFNNANISNKLSNTFEVIKKEYSIEC